jgi:Tfp pilus assembly protein PilV
MLRSLQRLRCQRGFSMVEQLAVGAITLTAAAAVVPATMNTVNTFRVNGGAHGIVNHLAVAKLRATANFTRSRLYADLAANSYHIEMWQKTGTPGWVVEGGIEQLPQGAAFGFGTLTAAPPGAQATLGQAPACSDNSGAAIANTACVVFNSGGIPIDATGSATANDALYMTGSGGVFGATLSAASRVQLWWTPAGSASWTRKQ